MADYDITAAFEAIENELIDSMMKNFSHHRAEETELGYNWSQWQAEQLRGLEEYRRKNKKQFSAEFSELNGKISEMIRLAHADGEAAQEVEILKAIQNGFKAPTKPRKSSVARFFKVNDRKLDSLIKATENDLQRAEYATLRRANDQYRKAIFNAQVYANTGSATYEKAVDMAVRDMLRAGLNSIEYKNGARHTLSDYADMAVRTANKRAYLSGEGKKRAEWGISTVIINRRQGGCPRCARFIGKIYIDDVWSGGKKSDGKYPLLSSAIDAGLYHPRCKDSHSTYFEGITRAEPLTEEKLAQLEKNERLEQQENYYFAQAKKNGRIAKYSLDKEDKKVYSQRAAAAKKQAEEIREKRGKTLEKSGTNDIINSAITEKAVNNMYYIGKIDVEKFKRVSEHIITDNVIITDERINHIKERHPNDFELYHRFLRESVADPDYIIKANKPKSALLLKAFEENKKQFKMILRLVTPEDNPQLKNSIITFMKINNQEWNRLINNKIILYKSE